MNNLVFCIKIPFEKFVLEVLSSFVLEQDASIRTMKTFLLAIASQFSEELEKMIDENLTMSDSINSQVGEDCKSIERKAIGESQFKVSSSNAS